MSATTEKVVLDLAVMDAARAAFDAVHIGRLDDDLARNLVVRYHMGRS